MALDTDSDLPAVTAAVTAPLNALQGLVDEVVTIAREESLPPVVKAPLERLGGALQPLLAAGKIVETIARHRLVRQRPRPDRAVGAGPL